jgi:hemerythrin-like domain-containing protein
MDAIDILMEEHQVILRGIDGLTGYAAAVRGGAGDPAELPRFVTFIREYADACHHGKEEAILFEAMAEAGFPREAGPLAVMLHEHERGRALVGELDRLGQAVRPWTSAEREAVHAAASGYAELLRAHIQKEDGILYPMAEERLPALLRQRVERATAAFEAEQLRSGDKARLERLGAELARHGAAPGLRGA